MSLGSIIRVARKRAGLSLSETAEAAKITKSHLWGIEQGCTINIGIVVALRLATVLDLEIVDLAHAARKDFEQ